VASGLFALRLPRIFIKLYAWFHRHVLCDSDPVYASLVKGWHVKDGQEFYRLVGRREDYRAEWFDHWQEEKLAAGDETRRQQASVEGLRVYVPIQRRRASPWLNVRACVRACERPSD
jgi:hypothetical protein